MKLHTLLLLLCAAVPSSAASLDSLGFDPPARSINVGDTFTVSLDIGQLTQRLRPCPGVLCFQGISNLYDWQVEIDFDPNVFQALEVDEGTFLPATGATTFFPGFTDNADGSVSFILESLEGATGGADTEFNGGELMSVMFQAIAASPGSTISVAPGSCFQTYVDLGTSDCSISPFLDTSAVATVSVNAVSPVPEPSLQGLNALLFCAIVVVLPYRKRNHSEGAFHSASRAVKANRLRRSQDTGKRDRSLLNGNTKKLSEVPH
jgi:hypothetical protein